jgi:hypothetical protein
MISPSYGGILVLNLKSFSYDCSLLTLAEIIQVEGYLRSSEPVSDQRLSFAFEYSACGSRVLSKYHQVYLPLSSIDEVVRQRAAPHGTVDDLH